MLIGPFLFAKRLVKWSFSGRKPAHKLDSGNTSNGSIKLMKNLLCKLAAETNVFFAKTMSMYLWTKLKEQIKQIEANKMLQVPKMLRKT